MLQTEVSSNFIYVLFEICRLHDSDHLDKFRFQTSVQHDHYEV